MVAAVSKNDIARHREGLGRQPQMLVSGRHEGFPHGPCPRRAEGAVSHRGAVGVAHPDPHHQVWRIPQHHVVLEILAGSRLRGSGEGKRQAAPADGVIAQDIGDHVGVSGPDDLHLLRPRVLKKDGAIAVLDPQDRYRAELAEAFGEVLHRGHPFHDAIVGDGGVGEDHVQGFDLAGAQGSGEAAVPVVGQVGDAELVGRPFELILTYLL